MQMQSNSDVAPWPLSGGSLHNVQQEILTKNNTNARRPICNRLPYIIASKNIVSSLQRLHPPRY